MESQVLFQLCHLVLLLKRELEKCGWRDCNGGYVSMYHLLYALGLGTQTL